MISKLIQTIRQIVKLSAEEEEFILQSFSERYFKKGEMILREGEVSKYVGFLEEGLVRYFVFKNEEESTFEFTQEGEFISDYQSFRHQTPSKQNIEAIEDSKVLLINYETLQNVFNTINDGNLLGRVIVEHRFDTMVNRLLSVYMHSHEERYHNFIEHYSELSQRIPQYMIASYVGVKPESLSRIRGRYGKKTS